MGQYESRSKLRFIMIILLMSMLMVFTYANAETAGESTLRNALTRISSVISAKSDSPLPERHLIREKAGNYPVSANIILPASLRTIQDEAFEGTALVFADLSGTSVEKIGERAFANIPTLIGIRIPEKTRFIARSAFAGSEHVTLTGAPGGYTRTWAKENGIPFAPIASFTANSRTVQFGNISQRNSETLQTGLPADYEGKDGNSPTRQTVGVIKDKRCQEGIAYHIQGRAPPACASAITNKT